MSTSPTAVENSVDGAKMQPCLLYSPLFRKDTCRGIEKNIVSDAVFGKENIEYLNRRIIQEYTHIFGRDPTYDCECMLRGRISGKVEYTYRNNVTSDVSQIANVSEWAKEFDADIIRQMTMDLLTEEAEMKFARMATGGTPRGDHVIYDRPYLGKKKKNNCAII